MKETKRILALLLSLSMALMPMPVQVFAAGNDTPAAVATAKTAPDAEPTEPPTAAPYTDGYTEIPVGCTLTLYDFPAEMYNNVSVFPENAEIIREEGSPYLKLHALHEGTVTVRAENAPAWYDHMFRGGSSDKYFLIVADTEDTQTRTEHSGFWVKNGETRRLGFWNPADMQAEDAEFDVLYGADHVEVTYDKGSDWLNITGKSDGIAVIEVREKRTEKAVRVRVMVSDEKPTEQSMYPETKPLTEPATQPPTQVTDPFEPLATTTTNIESTEYQAVGSSTTATTATTEEWTSIGGAKTVLKYDNDTVAVGGKLEIQVRYGHMSDSLIPGDLVIDGYDPYLSWKYDISTGILTVYGREPGTAELEIKAKGAQESARMTLHVTDTNDTTPSGTGAATTTTTTTTTTTVHADYYPIVTYNNATMAVGETRRVHVEHPEYGAVSHASISISSGGLISYMFDAATSDLYITAVKPFDNATFTIYAADCALSGFVTLTAVESETTGVALSTTVPGSTTEATVAEPVTSTTEQTTTTVQTTATTAADSTENDGTLTVLCDTDTLTVGGSCLVYVAIPGKMPPAEAADYTYEISDESLAVVIYSPEQKGYVVRALRPGSFKMSVYYKDQVGTVSFLITEASETAANNIVADYDDSPMAVGEVRLIRLYDKEHPDQLVDFHLYRSENDDCRVFHEDGTNHFYVVALRPGEAKLYHFGNADSRSDLVIPITGKSNASVQRLGYINEDDLVNAGDAEAILKEAARIGANGERTLLGERLAAADVNFDGLVNAKDANEVLRYAAYRGANAGTPDFPEYMAALHKEAETGLFLSLPQFMSQVGRFTADDESAWKDCSDEDHYHINKYRVFTSADEFKAYAAGLAEKSPEFVQFNDGKTDLTELAADLDTSGHFEKYDLLAIASSEPGSDFRYALGDVRSYPDASWDIQIIRKNPTTSATMGCATLTLLMVDKSVEFARDIRIRMVDTEYDQEQAIPFSAYVKYAAETAPEEPLFITSAEQLAEVFGDTSKSGWMLEGDVMNKHKYSPADAATIADGDFFKDYSLLYLRTNAGEGFYELHVADAAFNKETGELTVTTVWIDEPQDIMGGWWGILVQVRKEIADQVTSVRGGTTRELNTREVLTGKQAIRLETSSTKDLLLVCNSTDDLKAAGYGDLTDANGAAYDGDFFKTHSLVLMGKLLTSGSFRPNLTRAVLRKGTLSISGVIYRPAIVTNDLAYWLIVAETEKLDIDSEQILVNWADLPTYTGV